MALSFPNSPTNGQLYTDTTSGNRWVWDDANTVWTSTSTFTQTITVSSTQPGSPVVGQLWWNQDYGRLFVYYNDGTSSQWVDASPSDYTSGLAYLNSNAAFGKANTALQNTSGTFAGTLTVSGQVSAIGNNNIRTTYVYPTSWSSVDSSAYGYSPIPGELAIINNQDGTTNSFASIYLQGGLNAGGGAGINSGRIALLRDGNAAYAGAMVFANRDASSANMTERMRIDSSGRVTKPYQPGCLVGKSDGQWTGTCIFNLTSGAGRHNTGGHYNVSNGRFTCPIAGRYYVNVNTITQNNNSTGHIFFNLHVNGSVYYTGYSYNGTVNTHDLRTINVIMNLNAGDYIEVIGGSGAFYGASGDYTNMSVMLVA